MAQFKFRDVDNNSVSVSHTEINYLNSTISANDDFYVLVTPLYSMDLDQAIVEFCTLDKPFICILVSKTTALHIQQNWDRYISVSPVNEVANDASLNQG